MKPKPTNNTVNILGIPYEVKRVPYINRNAYIAGEINFEAQEIRLLDSLKEGMAETTLYHELIHGILVGLKFVEESDNEKLVQGLAVGLYECLKDDPAVIFNLTHRRRQSMNKKQTSLPVATKASKILTDGRTSKTAKTVAGSALSQTKTTGKGKSKK